MVHIAQLLWPADPGKIVLENLTETEMWVFKERLYAGLVETISGPDRYGAEDSRGRKCYTTFEDNAGSLFGVWTNGNPELAWCYITALRKI